MKDFKTIDEQFEILINRGLTINNEFLTKNYLLFNNYYNVINGYGKFLIDDTASQEIYKNGSNFTEIVKIAQFDSMFKSALFKFLLDIEHYFISVMAYLYSKQIGEHQEAYREIRSYKIKSNSSTITGMVNIFNKIIKDKLESKHNNSIKHYQIVYKSIPFWVIADYLSFGQALTFYSILEPSLQNQIAKEFSIKANNNLNLPNNTIRLTSDTLYTILSNLKEIRNLLAHNNKIFNYNCRANFPYFPEIHSNDAQIPKTGSRQNIYNSFVIMKLFLNEKQYSTLYNTLLDRFKRLNKALISIDMYPICKSLGFPENFCDYTKLSQ